MEGEGATAGQSQPPYIGRQSRAAAWEIFAALEFKRQHFLL